MNESRTYNGLTGHDQFFRCSECDDQVPCLDHVVEASEVFMNLRPTPADLAAPRFDVYVEKVGS